MKSIIFKTISIVLMLGSALVLATSCSDAPEDPNHNENAYNYLYLCTMCFTEDGYVGERFNGHTEEVHVGSEAQIITLRFLRLYPTYGYEMADTFELDVVNGERAYNWDKDWRDVWPSMIDSNSDILKYDDSWYEAWTEEEEGKTIIRVKLENNDSAKIRRMTLQAIMGEFGNTCIWGRVTIYQTAE